MNRDDDTLSRLEAAGLTRYEAMCYLALLKEGEGNGYAVGKASGVPTAKVYETLASLVAKGFAVSDGMSRPTYQAVDHANVIADVRERFSRNLDHLAETLDQVSRRDDQSSTRRFRDRLKIEAAIRSVITEANSKLLMSGWPEDLERFQPELEALAEKADIHLLANGSFRLNGVDVHEHRRLDLLRDELPERRLLVVNDRLQGVAAAFALNDEDEAIWSDAPGIVKVFADHILHDVSLNWALRLISDEKRDMIDDELTRLRATLYL